MFGGPWWPQRRLELADEPFDVACTAPQRLGGSRVLLAARVAHHCPVTAARGVAERRVVQHAVGAALHERGQRVGANVDPTRDVMLTEGPLDHLDHAPTRQFYGGKIGIDATHKGTEEGTREWPPEIRMTDEIRELVDRRWAEYGL